MKIIIALTIFLLTPNSVFSQHSMKIGVGAEYLPKLSHVHYPFRQESGVAGFVTGEMEMYFSKFGISVDASISSLKTSEIGVSLKLANTGWQRTRTYAIVFYTGAFNKNGNSILLLGAGVDVKLSALVGGGDTFLKNVDAEARILLPAKMFSKTEVASDVMARISLSYRLFNF